MAQTLEEFLVSVKYNIDAPSQQTFFNALKKAATSVGGVAAEMTALSIAIVKLSDVMGQMGEKLYWMSQRVGDGVSDIQNMAFAMSNLGVSAGEATNSIERFGQWSRSMGPAATGYLRSLGVTARDTVGQMRQLSDYFRREGGTLAFAHGTDAQRLQYAITMRRAQLMGFDEKTMLAMSSGQMEAREREGGAIARLVWGKDWQAGPQKFADQSVLVMNQFRRMGFLFTNLSQQFGLSLFTAILPDLEKVNKLIISIMPQIQEFMRHVISYAPAAMHFLEGVIKGFGFMLEVANAGMKAFDALPEHLTTMMGLLATLPGAIKLIGSPIFWILAGVTSLILLLDDYRGHLYDLEHKDKKPGAFLPWDKIENMAKPFLEMAKSADDFIERWTGIKNGVEWIIGIGLVGLLGGFGQLAAVVAGIAGVFWGPVGIILGITAAMAGLKLTGMLQEQLKNEALAAGYRISDPGDEANAIPPSWVDPSGKPISEEEMAKRLGHKFGYVTPMELDPHLKEQYGPPGPPHEDMPNPTTTYNAHDPNPWGRAPPVGGSWDLSDTMIGRLWRRMLQGPENIRPPRGQGAPTRRGIGGEYQLSSLGDDWMPPSAFGGRDTEKDEIFTPERLFNMLRDNLSSSCESLSDILQTLMAMADKMGVDSSLLPGGGGGGDGGEGGGGGGDSTWGPMLKPGAPQEEQEARLKQIMQRESGGRNVWNYKHNENPNYYTASGYYQMVDSTWRWAAQRAGIDASRYRHAMDAPFELQHAAALALMNAQGEQPWATSAPRSRVSHPPLGVASRPDLSHQPLGADGSHGAPAAGFTGGGKGYAEAPNFHNQVAIHVVAPSPASAAAQVAENLTRVHEHQIRFAQGALLA